MTPDVEKSPDEIRQAIEKLRDEHATLKQRVQTLHDKIFLSPEQQLEVKTLQKMKLLKKDAIAALEGMLT